MVIDWYTNSVPPGRMYNSLSNHRQSIGYLRDACGVESPSVYMEYDPYYMNINYAYIPDFGRYYRITGRQVDGKRILISLASDVMVNFRSVILNSDCIAERSSSRFSIGLEDGFIKAEQGYRYNFSKFPYTFGGANSSYVLTVTGGDPQP